MNPQKTSTIYVGSDKHGVHRSEDCGATWTKANTGRNGAVLDAGGNNSMVIDPVNPNVLYSPNVYGPELGLWKSINGGVDWDQLFAKGGEVRTYAARNAFAVILSLDPTDHTHLLVAFHDGCTGPYAPDCIGETTDSGSTWRLVKIPVNPQEGNGVIALDYNTWLYGIPFSGLWRTTDRGENWTKVANDGSWSHYRTAAGNDFVGTAQAGLMRSTDGGATWTPGRSGGPLWSVVGDGQVLYAVRNNCTPGGCYFTSPESDGLNWTAMPSPSNLGIVSSAKLAYDTDHHILYSSNTVYGLWRVVTR